MGDLFYESKKTKKTVWRCGECKAERAADVTDGVHVKVGNLVIAIVCQECMPNAEQSVQAALGAARP